MKFLQMQVFKPRKNDDRVRSKKLSDLSGCMLGVKPFREWQCYELVNRVGLLYIKNPFTNQGQRYWLARCIQDYSKSPNVVNLSINNFDKMEIEDWWKSLQNCKDIDRKKKLKSAMRWSTLGYHHDWDTKVYSEKKKNKFPTDLADLSSYFAKALGFGSYSAEAAIVNYYPIGTTLAGHTDHSEADLEAPLFSFSFGQKAIFLIGGPSKEEKPTALFLKSGDVVIMSKESRLCYHAVPRVMKCNYEPWNSINSKECIIDDFNFNGSELSNSKRIKLDNEIESGSINMNLWNQCSDEEFWSSFNLYLKDSRININVRQVLKEGQSSL
ncbi:nucleic acid dioxygenase ALKBH1 isoform X2 [Condylostylus longicornis]|uniref:nucleic acid dioxygenase ALKBH1 isoform X2 n=1 Tax=Condylostylus longicornis TaxID=2530218 RepID=UPI00244E10F1|nr:nucleic acid dioxygenase ALKBH1 isoform X2 [Condylostylus longicornis]